ncbi:MAG: I78 family peptidase inhibitor [Afipia sp.]|nr:I78 family peptidase inhibitor [Afipia sp.]
MTLNSRLLTAGTLALAVLTVAASQSVTRQAEAAGGAGICRRDAAEALAGKKRITNAQARRITGASIVRQVRPGQAVTMDYRRERVTIETDPKIGRIVRAYCG